MGYTKDEKKRPIARKAQVEVITIMLILAITVAAVFAAYQFATPQIERSKDVSRINSMQKALLELDKKIREVRFEGEGAQRYIDINFDKGNIRVNQNEDTIWFYMAAPRIESAPQQVGMDTYFSGSTINIRLQYGGEIEILSRFEVLNTGQYRIYIKNEGANDILLSLSPEIPITGDTWVLQGYVYDNTEGGNNDGVSDERQPTMDNNNNKNIFDAADDSALSGAEVIFVNQKQQIVAVTKTNSEGKYAVKLPKSDGVKDLELYIIVNMTSYVMKENDGATTIYSKVDRYDKDFILMNESWKVNINESIGKNINDFSPHLIDGYFCIPMYRLSKQDVFENVPIALILPDTTGPSLDITKTDFDNLLFDTMDAFDNTPGSTYHCNYFVVFGSVNSPQGIGDGTGNWITYPGTTQQVYMYPIEWLLDLNAQKGPTATGYGTDSKFKDIAAVDGNPDILNYKDFSLIMVASGACNDISGHPNGNANIPSGLLEKLHIYQNEMSNFLSLDRLKFKGVDYSRGLIVFGQFSEVSTADPDKTPRNKFYPNLTADREPPSVINVFIAPDGQHGQVPPYSTHPLAYFNSSTGGKIIITANVKDANEILSVTAQIKSGTTEKGAIILQDNGLSPDRIAGDGTYSGEWSIPSNIFNDNNLNSLDVSIIAIDEYGNSIVKSTFLDPDSWGYSPFQFKLQRDNIPPIEVTSPSIYPSTSTISDYIYVNSTVADSTNPKSGIDRVMYGLTRLRYDGIPSFFDNHIWRHYIGLAEGNNTYSIATYDRAGNMLIQSFNVLKDTTPPSIISIPTPPPLEINYQDSGSGIDTAILYANSSIKDGPKGFGSNQLQYNGTFGQGTHSAVAYIKDKKGNIIVYPWQFDINTSGPNLNVTYPANMLTFTQNGSITVNASTTATGGISYDVNSTVSSNIVSLGSGLNRISIKADGNPTGNDTNNTVITRWVVRDTTPPSLTVNKPSASSPLVVRAGDIAPIIFSYNEDYPAYYTITIYNGTTVIGQTTTQINTPGSNSIIGSGNHQIIGIANISPSAQNGLYNVNVTMVDLAGNNVKVFPPSINTANTIKIDNSGPAFSNISPGHNSWGTPTEYIQVYVTEDLNAAGVDRNSIRMYILGESNSSDSAINVEVTADLNVTPYSDASRSGYIVKFKPSWPFEDIDRINATIEASDKIGNRSSQSWFYTIWTYSPDIDNLFISTNRAKEGETVNIQFDVKQCVCPAYVSLPSPHDKFNAITEVTISVGKIGQIVYNSNPGSSPSKLVYNASRSNLGGVPASITVSHFANGGGVCSTCHSPPVQMELYRYNFNGANAISFNVPDYAGDILNNISVTAKNYGGWKRTNTETLYLITTKNKIAQGGTVSTYGKYSWLPKFDGTDLSIGRISKEPIGGKYQIYGKTNDVHRIVPVVYIKGAQAPRVDESDASGNKIEIDHGRIPLKFTKEYSLELATRQNTIEKFSLENPVMNTLPNEFPLCVHGYFDTTDTLWTSNNFMLREKQFVRMYEKIGDTIINAPAADGGPVLLIRERRNSFNNLISGIVVTTADLDRYKNNRQSHGQNMHSGESYEDLARNLEENIIVWACGHELLID